jgi:hypothetical protein
MSIPTLAVSLHIWWLSMVRFCVDTILSPQRNVRAKPATGALAPH